MAETNAKSATQSRAWACEQALASSKIEGFQESPGFRVNFDDWKAGRISHAEFRARETERIMATVNKNG